MHSALTRRAVATALPIAAMVAPVVTLAAVEAPDAELLRLGEELSVEWARELETARALDLAAPENDDHPLYAAHDAQFSRTGDVVKRIEALRATTLAGLIVKARACHWCHSGEAIDASFFDDDTTDMRLAAGILGDLVAIERRLARPRASSPLRTTDMSAANYPSAASALE